MAAGAEVPLTGMLRLTPSAVVRSTLAEGWDFGVRGGCMRRFL